MVTKTEIATGNVTTYTYDHRNRLTKIEEKSSGGILLKELSFVYDVEDRRIVETIDADGEGLQAAQTTRFVYDSDHVWADFDQNGTIKARYLYGDNVDQLLARYRPGEGTAWYLTDHLGTVRDIVNAAGSLIDHIDYDSFGRILAETNVLFGDRYKFTGREFISESGLYYYRARWYNPATGRFLSTDPIGFSAGDANLYRYVANSPLGAVDPSGQLALVEYAKKLGRGAVGSIIASAMFRCFVQEIVMWGGSKVVFSDYTFTHNDVASISLGVISCTMFPASAFAQGTFLLLSETLYLYATGATTEQIAATALMHTLGIAGGAGLSRYGAKAWGKISNSRPGQAIGRFLADESGCLRLPIGKRIRFPSWKKAYEGAKKAGQGREPVHHPNGEHGPHYHAADPKGKPLNHDHYYYPDSQR
jgi:RHS repeat-associated protein